MKKHTILAFVVMGMILNASAMKATNAIEDNTLVSVTDEYEKISSSELTPPVVEELLKEYPTSKLGAAYRNSKGEFKLIMVLKSGTRRTVYIDAHGNWLNKK